MMINLTSNKCLNCDKFCTFGYPGGKKQCCVVHKREGMINLNKRAK